MLYMWSVMDRNVMPRMTSYTLYVRFSLESVGSVFFLRMMFFK